ncbi:hypothetical protein GQR58_008695 [Nymphon striatum]|nr:hypothetical protein GQR58_008695 [Nymphon striatum]
MHYTLNYPRLMREVGPLIRHWVMQYEEKHNFFKRAAVVVGNFINLAKTLAIRHQMHQLVHLNGGGLLRKNGCCATSGHPVNLSNFRCSNNAAELLKTSMATECMKIVIFGTPYKCGDTLLIIIDNDSVVSLGEINKVIVNADEEVCFIVHKFTVQRYDEHFHSWMIHMPDHPEMTAVLHKDFPDYYPVELLKTSMATECMKIVIFGTPYKCGDTLLIIIDNDSVVSLGEINKVIVNADEEVCFIVHKFTVQRYDEHFHSWMIHMPDHTEMTAVLHKDLPDYYPVGVHKCSHNAAELLKTSMATECMKIVIFGTPYKCGDTLLIIIDNDSVVSLGEINKVIVNADEEMHQLVHLNGGGLLRKVVVLTSGHPVNLSNFRCSHNAAELLKTSMATECMKIVIFGTPYKCGDTLLIIIDNDSVVSLGEIYKVIVNANEAVQYRQCHLRTRQTFDDDQTALETTGQQSHGVTSSCFLQSKYFHRGDAFAADLHHDVLEGLTTWHVETHIAGDAFAADLHHDVLEGLIPGMLKPILQVQYRQCHLRTRQTFDDDQTALEATGQQNHEVTSSCFFAI